MRILCTTLATAVTGAALALAAPLAAHATTESRSSFELTLSPGKNATPAKRTAFLACNPPSGSHPNAKLACRDLTEADGDFTLLSEHNSGSAPQMCTAIYSPVTVTAKGRWNNRPVIYQGTFGNECVMRRATGNVFAF
jgi:hypothetical protein